MIKKNIISVVIPCYKVENKIRHVLKDLLCLKFIDHIIIVDDACPNQSFKIAEQFKSKKIFIIKNKENLGVGGSVKLGYKKSLNLLSSVIILGAMSTLPLRK